MMKMFRWLVSGIPDGMKDMARKFRLWSDFHYAIELSIRLNAQKRQDDHA